MPVSIQNSGDPGLSFSSPDSSFGLGHSYQGLAGIVKTGTKLATVAERVGEVYGATVTFPSPISSSLGRKTLTREDPESVATVNPIDHNFGPKNPFGYLVLVGDSFRYRTPVLSDSEKLVALANAALGLADTLSN